MPERSIKSLALLDLLMMKFVYQEDMSKLPSQSFFYIEGRLNTDNDMEVRTQFVNNGYMTYLFSEIRYKMNDIVVYSVISVRLHNASWYPTASNNMIDTKGNWDFQDYKKVILNIWHELALIRSNADIDAILSIDPKETKKIELDQIYWKRAHITEGLPQKLVLTNYIDQNVEIHVPFRS